MLISKSRKFIFVHNQRTGGASIRNYFEKHVPDVEYLLPNHAYAEDGIEKLGREEWDKYYSFGFVRNPWARLVSWYLMISNPPKLEVKIPNVNLNNDLWKYVRENSSNFEEFLKKCTDTIVELRNGFEYKKSLVKNQFDYFTDKEGKIAVSFIGKFENLTSDFKRVQKNLGLPEKNLPRTNANKPFNYRMFYNEETRELVTQRFKKDIDYFNYSFG